MYAITLWTTNQPDLPAPALNVQNNQQSQLAVIKKDYNESTAWVFTCTY